MLQVRPTQKLDNLPHQPPRLESESEYGLNSTCFFVLDPVKSASLAVFPSGLSVVLDVFVNSGFDKVVEVLQVAHPLRFMPGSKQVRLTGKQAVLLLLCSAASSAKISQLICQQRGQWRWHMVVRLPRCSNARPCSQCP